MTLGPYFTKGICFLPQMIGADAKERHPEIKLHIELLILIHAHIVVPLRAHTHTHTHGTHSEIYLERRYIRTDVMLRITHTQA